MKNILLFYLLITRDELIQNRFDKSSVGYKNLSIAVEMTRIIIVVNTSILVLIKVQIHKHRSRNYQL